MKFKMNAGVLVIFLLVNQIAYTQKADSTKNERQFSGAVSVTNNGLSFIPTFSLGKPAAIFNLTMGKGRLSFEPELRFSLEGKPWSFLFWWRYKLLKADKFRINIGTNPSLNFSPTGLILHGVSNEYLIARRYVATEFVSNYSLVKNVSIGIYYLYSRGLDPGTTRSTHYLTLNANFTNIKLAKKITMRLVPQVYYLNLDQLHGYYFSTSMNIARKKFPLSLSAVINKTIKTDIVNKNFVWNVTLVYSFNRKYSKIAQAL